MSGAAPDIVGVDPRPEVVDELLRGLPEWFGIEESIEEYVAHSRALPTYVASFDGEPVGVLVVQQHGPSAAEMYVLAVSRPAHRRGVGRALVERVEADLRRAGVAYLQVKTLGAAHPSPEYADTRRFYEALGYAAIEEFAADELWPGNPCLLMVKHLACGANR